MWWPPSDDSVPASGIRRGERTCLIRDLGNTHRIGCSYDGRYLPHGSTGRRSDSLHGAARSRLAPTLHLPSVVLEIVDGIVVGPAILGLVEVDLPLKVLALLGLAFLLLLAGLEIDLDRLRGTRLRSAAAGFVISLAVGLGIGLGLYAASLIQSPLLVAIILSSTSLGIVIPVLADAGQSSTTLGQLIIASSSIADFGAIILLSLFFSEDSSSVGSTLLLIGGFVALIVAIGLALAEVERSSRLSSALARLQDSSAQIRVRGAFLLLIGLVVIAQGFGLEVILGAFFAGAVLRLL